MFCRQCGTQVGANATSCVRCGAPADRTEQARAAPVARSVSYAAVECYEQISPKSRLVMLLLCLGFLVLPIGGLHRFYAGKIGTGVLWLCTFNLLYVGWLVDLIFVVSGAFRDGDGRRIVRWVE